MGQLNNQPPAYPADVIYQQTYPPPDLAPWPPKRRRGDLVVAVVVAGAVLALVAAAGAVAWFLPAELPIGS